MSRVIGDRFSLTGKWRYKPSFFNRPVVWVEVLNEPWDTNTGYDEPSYKFWRKASYEETVKLKAKDRLR